MATTANYTRRQGEVWRTTIEMFDSNNCAILLASRGTDGPTGHQAFFAGTATKMIVTGQDPDTGNDITGEYNLPISFKLKPAETIESGRGSNRRTEEGYFKVEAFIPADIDQTTITKITQVTIGSNVNVVDETFTVTLNGSSPFIHTVVSGSLTREDIADGLKDLIDADTNYSASSSNGIITITGNATVGDYNIIVSQTSALNSISFVVTRPFSLSGLINSTAPTSTIEMPTGDWEYVIRYSDSENPSSDQNVRVIVDGILTIEELVADLGSNPGTFDYTAPGE